MKLLLRKEVKISLYTCLAILIGQAGNAKKVKIHCPEPETLSFVGAGTDHMSEVQGETMLDEEKIIFNSPDTYIPKATPLKESTFNHTHASRDEMTCYYANPAFKTIWISYDYSRKMKSCVSESGENFFKCTPL